MMGLNPQHHNSLEIRQQLGNHLHILELSSSVSHVYFYGAGCSSPEANQIVEDALRMFFTKASISVAEDLLAVAHATCSGETAICCILGTGSNCFYYDGKTSHMGISGLGYILGDEGSAGDIGKKLIKDFLHEKLPDDIKEKLIKRYQLNRNEIVKRVYRTEGANVYLASFSAFVGEHKEHPYCHALIKESLEAFVQLHILYFKNAQQVPVHFVGSVAYHFCEILKEILAANGLQMGKIMQRPLDGLIEYHRGAGQR
jgi:N-acetylglucosamine kinase-like BadF-type ATPase